MERLVEERVRRSSPPSARARGVLSLILPALVMLTAAGDLVAQDPAAPRQPATTAPATAPASAPAEPSTAQLAEWVLKIAGQSDPQTRRDAAVRILKMGSDASVQALLPIFDRQNDEAAKLAVCEAIAEAGASEPAFRQPLLALLDHTDATLREAAVAALAGYRGDPEVDQRLKDLDRQLLIEVLVAQSRELYALLPEADRAARLQAWLGSPFPFVRETALDIIYQTLKKKAVEPPNGVQQQLRTMLNDPEETVRKELVEILRDLRQLEDARLLAARLEHEDSAAVRELIYHALGYLRNPESVPVCVRGLKDPVDGVATKAAGALGELAEFSKPAPDPQVLQSAVDALLEKIAGGIADDGLRGSVIGAMANMADTQFLDVLAQHAGAAESVPPIRQAALRGIGRIGDPGQANLVIGRLSAEQDPAIRETAVEALGKLGSSLDHLKPLRDRQDPKVESSAAVQNKAWEAYRSIFLKLAPADQQRVIDSGPDEAIRLAADPQLPPEVREAVASRLLEQAQATGKKDAQAALGLLDKLAQAVAPDRLSPAWVEKFAQIRKTLQAATRPATTQEAG